ncbi:MAG: nucleoside hydrolase [Firmicutes bacterium]|nr:nucleoside hydrolase [Bacillota bacterium]
MQNIIIVTDPNKDPDDLVMLILAAAMEKRGKTRIAGVVTTSGNENVTLQRARYAKGVLKSLGIDVPVCAGTGKEYEDEITSLNMNLFHESAEIKEFMRAGTDVASSPKEFLHEVLVKCGDGTVGLLCAAGMTDIARLIISDKRLFLSKVSKIAIMGGLNVLPGGNIKMDDSYNNVSDFSASEVVRKFVSANQIKTVLVNRDAAREVPVEFEFYRSLLAGGHPVGIHAHNAQYAAFERLITAAQTGAADKKRDMNWLFKTFTTLAKDDYGKFLSAAPGIIINLIDRIGLYDPLTLIALVQDFENMFNYTEYGSISLASPKIARKLYDMFYYYISKYLANVHQQPKNNA